MAKGEEKKANPRAALLAAINSRGPPASVSGGGNTSALPDDKGEDKTSSVDPKLEKYFKMMKVGIPLPAAAQKLFQDGLSSSLSEAITILENGGSTPTDMSLQASSQTSEGSSASNSSTDPKDDSKYAKYMKMIKVGIPKEGAAQKMLQDGIIDSMDNAMAILEGRKPTITTSSSSTNTKKKNEGPKVALSDHPIYSKYFKMLRIGLQREAIVHKMKKDGVDYSMIDKDPSELLAISSGNETNDDNVDEKDGKVSPIPRKANVRKKRLHWSGLDASQLGHDSVWFESDDEDLEIDKEEFDRLFVEQKKPETGDLTPTKMKEDANRNAQGENKAALLKKKKKKLVSVIDGKRSQNGSIALAHVSRSMSLLDIKQNILSTNEEPFTVEQIMSLKEYLPDVSEATALKGFRSKTPDDVDQLGLAERYMLMMVDCRHAAKRLECMRYNKQFTSRVTEIRKGIKAIETACDDIKISGSLKKVLKAILKVGNQMNDGAAALGFRIDTLLKLASAKAFDKKTTILEYVVIVLDRNDTSALDFNLQLTSLKDAARSNMSDIITEYEALSRELKIIRGALTMLRTGQEFDVDPSKDGIMKSVDRLKVAESTLETLQNEQDTLKKKYAGIIKYFGEDEKLASNELFTTLNKFIVDFCATRDSFRAKKEAEEKRQKRQSMSAINMNTLSRKAIFRKGGDDGSGTIDGDGDNKGVKSSVNRRESSFIAAKHRDDRPTTALLSKDEILKAAAERQARRSSML